MAINKLFIGLVFGGKSSEHEVSIKSARNIFAALNSPNNKKYFVTLPIYIDKSGFWWDLKSSESIIRENKKDLTNNISFKEQSNKLINLPILNEKIDIWFPALHGPNGEDGVIQGLFKLTGKPFVGSGILGSSLGMDKIAMKSIFKSFNIPQAPYISFEKKDINNINYFQSLIKSIDIQISYPCFIKPANLGSSIGITKAYSEEQLLHGIDKAAYFDERIIIEKNINGRELECAILGKSIIKTSVIGEIKFQGDWYNYETKYNEGQSKTIIPANLSTEISNRVKSLAVQACQAINAYGLARVDFFYEDSTQKVYINEVNTLPGFTNTSMYPILWEASGLKPENLVASLIEIAKE